MWLDTCKHKIYSYANIYIYFFGKLDFQLKTKKQHYKQKQGAHKTHLLSPTSDENPPLLEVLTKQQNPEKEKLPF